MADAAAEARALGRQALAAWRFKVGAVAFAAVVGVVGVVLAPIALVASVLPFGASLSALAVAGLGVALGVPASIYLSLVAVPAIPSLEDPPEQKAEPEADPDLGEASEQVAVDVRKVAADQAAVALARDLVLQAVLAELQQSKVGSRVQAWGWGCVVLTKAAASAGPLLAAAGVVLAGLSLVPLPLNLAAVFAGPALSLVALGLACRRRFPLLLESPAPAPARMPVGERAAPPGRGMPERARPTGHDLFVALRASSLYRHQDVVVRHLEGAGQVSATGSELLEARYPVLSRHLLEQLGIGELTSSQTQALQELMEAELAPGRGHDVLLLEGWPGSGRTTLCNLLTLGTLLQREGAVYALVPESPQRYVSRPGATELPRSTRTPAAQLSGWNHLLGLGLRLQEAYADGEHQVLDLLDSPDLVVSDVRVLDEQVLANTTGRSRGLIQRLRLVVIDHPNRLPREDLVRMRIALSRLRMTAELLGRRIAFLVLLPPLDNAAAFASWLLNSDQVPSVGFSARHRALHLVGWLPPHEWAEDPAGRPVAVRTRFWTEVAELLAELGHQAHRVRVAGHDPLRIAVVDPVPLLGPELRDAVSQELRERVRSGLAVDAVVELAQDWTWFGASALSVSPGRRFDCIVCVGVGAHPEHLVGALRPALADGGLLVLVGDSSPTDYESLRAMRRPEWIPLPGLKSERHPSFVLPNHSEAVIAHELASLFDDFGASPVPRARLEGVFPHQHTRGLLETWTEEGALESIQVFEDRLGVGPPRRVSYLRRSARGGLSADRYEVPWGCCSRRVLDVYNRTAHARASRIGRSLSAQVDQDRLFTDLFVQAILRLPPNTVRLEGYEPHELSTTEQRLERAVVRGRLVVETASATRGIEVDRRAPRFDLDVVRDRPVAPDAVRLGEDERRGLDSEALAEALRVNGADGGARQARQARHGILAGLARPDRGPTGGGARLAWVVGSWVCEVDERLRDVVRTDARLVEEPGFVQVVGLSLEARRQVRRTYACDATVLALELSDRGRGELAQGDEQAELDSDLVESRAAHHGLARALRQVLRRSSLNFDDEYRIALVGTRDLAVRVTGWAAGPPLRGPARPGPLAAWRPALVADRVLQLLGPGAGQVVGLAQVAALYEWMHGMIGLADQPAGGLLAVIDGQAGTLAERACLFGSLVSAAGLRVRAVGKDGLLACQVHLGPAAAIDAARIAEEVRSLLRRTCMAHGLEDLNLPCRDGQLAIGWERGPQGPRRLDEAGVGSFPVDWSTPWIEEDEHGNAWLVVDLGLGGRFLGDCAGLRAAGLVEGEAPAWTAGVQVHHFMPGLTAWRLQVHRVREGELALAEPLQRYLLSNLHGTILPAVIQQLQDCDCEDGCAACCGGLGTVSPADFESFGADRGLYTAADLVSRRGAYRLACAVAGQSPDWEAYGAGARREVPGQEDADLQQLVREVVGTPAGNHLDGRWAGLFTGHMPLSSDWLAPARWMGPDDSKRLVAAGFYDANVNLVVVKGGRPRDDLITTIVHEYTHNWQFKSGRFDLDRLVYGPQALRFYRTGGPGTPYRATSALVLEGLARWADHTWRFSRGLGSLYRPSDPEGWDEYKTGYFMVLGIVHAFGEAGLFRWLSPTWGDGPELPSRDPRLAWGFGVEDALKALGLLEAALTGRMEGLDVMVAGEGEGGGEAGSEDSEDEATEPLDG